MDIVEVLFNLGDLPPEITSLIISYIPRPFLPLFLGYRPLVPCILPLVRAKVRIQQRYYNSEDPISFFSPSCYNVAPVFSLLEDLVNVIHEYGVCPKEIELVNLVTPMSTKYRLSQSGVLVNHELDPLVSKLMKWGLEYEELFHQIELVHILDQFMNSNIEELVFCIEHGFKIGSVAFLDNPEIIKVLPYSITNLILHAYSFKAGTTFMNFRNLKTIKVASASISIFPSLPRCVEAVVVSDLDTTPLWNGNGDLTLPNLRHLEAGIQIAGDFSSVAMTFPNLESFHIKNSRVADLDELGLPGGISVLEIDSSPGLVSCLKIEKFPQLKELSMTNMPFRGKLFESDEGFPELTKLSFIQSYDFNRNFGYDLDRLKFPQSLKVLGLHGHFNSTKWSPPQKLQELVLRGTRFANGFNIQLPTTLTKLFIVSTNLRDLDNIQFPSGLRELDVRDNEWLKSMVNTNLSDLTQLVRFDISLNPYLSKYDVPNEKLRCKRAYNLNKT
ncbi:hypothetical protein Cantr_06380 [Candida viswanathii]|uniref:Uncharacterized protein n=1 Tax=Candida viswanathii TaxID=5486 RepID=A0A367XZ86_9ASCO|nr:hypothetical protein Cantr_06380 [Candida viswanathii]